MNNINHIVLNNPSTCKMLKTYDIAESLKLCQFYGYFWGIHFYTNTAA